jgi:hypothetical protein
MRKIKSLFARNYETDRLIRDEIVEGCEWVVNGEGVATRKYDGTCCMIKTGNLYARYDVKKDRTPPVGFIPAQDKDETTGHWPGWVKCERDNKQWRWHFDALDRMTNQDCRDGTYELCGPKVNKNPEGYEDHVLIPHSEADVLSDCPRTFNEIKEYLFDKNIEGVVWHHPDGRMVKVKKKDFGIKRCADV